MMKQDGALVALNARGGSHWRKGYRGNRADDIWIQDVKTRKAATTDTNLQEFRGHTTDVYPMWGADGMIYFSSERDGTFNIWKIAAARASHNRYSIKRMASSSRRSARTGRRSSTRTSSTSGRCRCRAGTPTRVRLDLDFDPKENATSPCRRPTRQYTFSPSHEGDYLAVDFHGEVRGDRR